MKQVNTTYWDVFRIDKLFITEKKGKQVPTGANIPKLELKENGKTPRITVTAINNGILGYFDYVGEKPSNYRVYKNFISVSFLGTVFYQEGEASLDMKVHCLKPIEYELNKYTGEFLVTAVKASLAKYKYSDQLSSSVLPTLELFLPSKDGSPDWKYMEEYMRRIEQRTQTAISAFLASQNKPHKIDTTYWKEFIMEELFEKLDLKFWPKKFEKTKHVSTEKTKEFNIPLVNAKHSNNGIMYYGRETDFESEEMTIDIVADGAASTGDVYPQPQRTGVLYNAYLIKLKERKSSKAVLCFLSTVIERCVKQKFGYDNKCTWDKLKQEKILLPATPAGEPDWKYMEMYMRGVEAIAKEKIALLTKKKQEPVQQTSINNYGTVNIYEK